MKAVRWVHIRGNWIRIRGRGNILNLSQISWYVVVEVIRRISESFCHWLNTNELSWGSRAHFGHSSSWSCWGECGEIAIRTTFSLTVLSFLISSLIQIFKQCFCFRTSSFDLGIFEFFQDDGKYLKTTQNALARSFFRVLLIILKLGTSPLRTQAQNMLLQIFVCHCRSRDMDE